MAVVYGAQHLLDDVRCVALTEGVLLGYALEEFAAITKPKKYKKWLRAWPPFGSRLTYSVTKK